MQYASFAPLFDGSGYKSRYRWSSEKFVNLLHAKLFWMHVRQKPYLLLLVASGIRVAAFKLNILAFYFSRRQRWFNTFDNILMNLGECRCSDTYNHNKETFLNLKLLHNVRCTRTYVIHAMRNSFSVFFFNWHFGTDL